MINTVLDENHEARNRYMKIDEGCTPTKPRRSSLLILLRVLKGIGALVLVYLIVDKLYDMKSVYHDEMTPYASETYRQVVKFQQQFMSLGEGKDLEALVNTLGASYVGDVTSAQLRERIPSENYSGVVDLRLLPAVVRRQYTGDFKYGYYTLPNLGDCDGKMLVRRSSENKLLDYVVVYE